MKRIIAIGCLALMSLSAQSPPRQYIVTVTGSGKVTIQHLPNDPTVQTFVSAWFSCAAAQTVTLSWNGTGATATAGSAVRLPGTFLPSAATVWTASNAGGGTTGPVYNVLAGVDYPIDLSTFTMGNTGVNTNLNFLPSGTCTINARYNER